MIHNTTLAVAIIAGSIIGSNMMTTTPANAATCYFKAFNAKNPLDKQLVDYRRWISQKKNEHGLQTGQVRM